MKQLYYFTLICLLLSTATFAQTFKPIDHWTAGSTGQDAIADIAIDSAGNQYICGYFTGTVDVDPGSGVYNISTPSGYTQSDAYLIKLDANNNFIWAKTFGGTSDDFHVANKVEIDNQGNVIVHGVFKGNIRFESNGALWSTSPSCFYSPYLVKFTSSGTFQWGYGWYTNTEGFIWSVDFDSNNQLYIGGYFANTFDVNPLTGASNVDSRTSNGLADMFLMKMSENGTLLTTKTVGSTGQDLIGAVVLDQNGSIYVSGSFSGTIDLDFGSGTANITSAGGFDGFILKTDTTLDYKWAKTLSGSGNLYCRAMIRRNNTLINFGSFTQSIDLDPSTSNTATIMSNGNFDCYLMAIDTNGNYLWGQSFGGTGKEEAAGLVSSADGDILVSGYFENSVDFDSSPGSNFILNSAGGRDGYIAKHDSTGAFLNAVKYGSNTSNNVTEGIRIVNYSNLGDYIAGGSFYNTIDINPSTLVTQNVTSAGQDDMLYMKLDACLNQIVQYTANVCGNQFVLPSGGVVTQNGYYLDVILSSQGCDSTNGITVVLNPLPDTTITQTGATFSAQPGLSYQWFNCQIGQPIPGETNQTFTATANGQYAVIVSNGTCTDTSSCITLDNIGLAKLNLPQVNLYPNPTSGLLHIQSAQPWQSVSVLDVTGRVLLTQQHASTEIDLGTMPAGIYMVKVAFKEGVVVRRVVRE